MEPQELVVLVQVMVDLEHLLALLEMELMQHHLDQAAVEELMVEAILEELVEMDIRVLLL